MRLSGRIAVFCLAINLLLSGIAGAVPFDCGCGETDRTLELRSPPLSGSDVLELQTHLQVLGFYQDAMDGAYTQATADAVAALQAWAGLPETGIFGPAEQTVLSNSLIQVSGEQGSPNPPEGELRIEIDVDKRTLTVLVDDQVFKVFPCAVGKPSTKSPVGEWKIIQKGTHWGGGFGTRWLGLNIPWGIYGIHGTNKPSSIGTAASAGCIRMFNRDVEQLYRWVSVGTPVSIIGPFPRVKVSQPLRRGQTSKAVQTLQLSLREAGFNPGYTDGRFGEGTEAAVKQLQAYYGLRPTGQADMNVLALLGLR